MHWLLTLSEGFWCAAHSSAVEALSDWELSICAGWKESFLALVGISECHKWAGAARGVRVLVWALCLSWLQVPGAVRVSGFSGWCPQAELLSASRQIPAHTTSASRSSSPAFPSRNPLLWELSGISFLNSDNQSSIFNSGVLFQKLGESPKRSSADAALLNHKDFVQV